MEAPTVNHNDPSAHDPSDSTTESAGDINVLALVKGKERYIYLYDDSQQAEALRTLGRHAASPELSFSWYDAAVLGKKVRREAASRKSSRFSVPQSSDVGSDLEE